MRISGRRRVLLACLPLASALVLTSCGGSSGSSGSTGSSTASGSGDSAAKDGGTATVNLGAAPGSIDPQRSYAAGTQDAVWLAYTGLLTYARADGKAGTQVIPGLATDLPTVSADGLTYDLTLRPNLTYSDGTPVKASDFTYTIQRAIKLNWGGVSFFTAIIAGAEDYQSGKATTISGITTDDATGKITITLNIPYGPFNNVLALSGAGLVPSGTPMKDLAAAPPPGIGPYTISKVNGNYGFEITKVAKFADFKLPGIPAGHLDKIIIKTQSNPQSAAEDVLKNNVDAFDPSGGIPGSLLPQVMAQAKDRYASEQVPWTYYFWLNGTIAPFDNEQARLAVSTALDRKALVRLSSGRLAEACNFLPPGIAGHEDGGCVTQPNGPDLEAGKKILADAGLTGAPVTVWGMSVAPRDAFVNYYASLLTQLGFNVTTKLLAPAVFSATVSNEATQAQTGYGDWAQDFPHPISFTLPLSEFGISADLNYGRIDDPVVQETITKYGPTPSGELASVADKFAAMDTHLNEKALVLPFGYASLPKFLSNRIDFGKALFSPIYYNDYSSWQLVK